MTNMTLTFADKIFRGKANFGPLFSVNGKTGVPLHLPTKISLGAPLALDDDSLIDAATSTELPNNGTIIYTTEDHGESPFDNGPTPEPADVVMADGQTYSVWTLDVARTINSVMTHNTSVVASTLLITGFDEHGQRITELHTFTATGTEKAVVGKKAFKHVLSYAIASGGNSTSNTLNVGWANGLGLPYRLVHASDILAAYMDGAMELATATLLAADDTPATNVTGDPRGTIVFNTAPNGDREYSLWMYVADPNSVRGLIGVDPA